MSPFAPPRRLRFVLAGLCMTLAAARPNLLAQTNQIEEIMERDGRFVFTDGSSYFVFQKDSTFLSGPLGISSRVITARWRHEAGTATWTVEGQWTWVNGPSPLDDHRRMTMTVSGRFDPPEQMRLQFLDRGAQVPVYRPYMAIESLGAIPPSGSAGRGKSPAALPTIQRLSAVASGRLDRAEWRVEESGCMVRLTFAPVPTGASEPSLPVTQVWLLRTDGTVLPTTPSDEVARRFESSRVVATIRTRIYSYPLSVRTEALSLVVRVGDEFFVEAIRN